MNLLGSIFNKHSGGKKCLPISCGLRAIAPLLTQKTTVQPVDQLRHLSGEDITIDGALEELEFLEGDSEADVQSAQLAIFLLFVALLVGQCLKHISLKFSIPYTPLLTVLGVAIGIADRLWMDEHGDDNELAAHGQLPKEPASVDPGADPGTEGPIELEEEVDPRDVYQQTTESFHSPEPELVFLLFLPALIFESAFNSDWYTFKRQFVKILLMAGPMLLFSTFATALIMYYVLGFQSDSNNMSWIACVLFGAIISATDPVAVVALLKELGVTKRVSTLIEGESLLNDGTALVLFLILIELVEGEDMSAGKMIGMFCRLSFGGPLLGLAFGIIMAFALSRIHNQPILEANLTVCMPYILFYIAEHHYVHVSGILALVAMGLYMTNRGRTRISTESEEAIHSIWSYIGFVAETLIFLLTGIVLGGEFVASDNLEAIWFLQLLGLYVFLHLIRFIGLILLLPCMRLTGYSFTIRQVVLLAYSGLRGAVGLCLALMVKFNEEIDAVIRDQIMFFTAGIVLLTLIVNAPTTGCVVRALGLSKENEMSKRMLHKVLSQHDKQAEHFIQKWKQERSEHGDRNTAWLDAEDLDLVALKKYKETLIQDLHLSEIELKYPMPPGSAAYLRNSEHQQDEAKREAVNVAPASSREDQLEAQTGALATDRPLISPAESKIGVAAAGAGNLQLPEQQSQGIRRQLTLMTQYAAKEANRNMDSPEAELRSRYLLEVKAAYMEHYEEGLVAPESLIILNKSINEALDRADTELFDWNFLHGLYKYGYMLRLGIRWQKLCCFGPLVHRWVYKEVRQIYDIFQNYMVCSYHALHLLSEMKSINRTVVQMVIDDVHKNLDECKDELINLRSGYPQLMQQVDTQHCEYYVLRQFTRHYSHLGSTGQIDMKHCELIQHELDRKIKALKLKQTFKKLDFEEMIERSQLGSIFPKEVAIQSCRAQFDLLVTPAQVILPSHSKKTVSVIDTLLKKDDAGGARTITNNRVYLISRGCVYEHLKQDFRPEGLDRQFSKRNKAIAKHLSSSAQMKDKLKNMTRRPNQDTKTNMMRYSVKCSAGKIIGLQNILPVFADKAEMVLFTDNSMVAEMHEINVEPLRQVIGEDREVLRQLWQKLLPGVLLLLFNQKLLEAPHFMTEKDWKTTTKMLAKYSDLMVLAVDETIVLPAGGFLLQGSLEQIVTETDFKLQKKKTYQHKPSNEKLLEEEDSKEQEFFYKAGKKDGKTKPMLLPGQKSYDHVPGPKDQIKDRTPFEAFSTINPDQVYAPEIKSRVTYSAKVKFTVVLAFKPFLKEAWQTANSKAYKNVQKLLEQEFTYHNSNTLLARKMNIGGGADLAPAQAMDKSKQTRFGESSHKMFSMRLLPNYQQTMRARKTGLGTMMKTNINVKNAMVEQQSDDIPSLLHGGLAPVAQGGGLGDDIHNPLQFTSDQDDDSDGPQLFPPINRQTNQNNWLQEQQKDEQVRTNGFMRKIATFKSDMSSEKSVGTPTKILVGFGRDARASADKNRGMNIELYNEVEEQEQEHDSSQLVECDANMTDLLSDNNEAQQNALSLHQSSSAQDIQRVKTKRNLEDGASVGPQIEPIEEADKQDEVDQGADLEQQ